MPKQWRGKAPYLFGPTHAKVRGRRESGEAKAPRPLSEEQRVQADVERDLTAFGWHWFHDEDSRKNNDGLTDVVAVHPVTGTVLFWEMKSNTGALTKPGWYVTKQGRNRYRRGQTSWRDAFKRTMQRAPGVVDYRVVRPRTYSIAAAFLFDEDKRAQAILRARED